MHFRFNARQTQQHEAGDRHGVASSRSRGRRLRVEVLESRHLLTGVVAEYPLAPAVAPLGTYSSHPSAITAGPDGNLWFTQNVGGADEIGRITPTGTVTEFLIPGTGAGPAGITAGPDGNLWFAATNSNTIDRVTPTGVFSEFAVPTANSGVYSIAAGADGNLWFTEFNSGQIGRITTSGVVTEFPISTVGGSPSGIAAGADGNLWFTLPQLGQIGRITTAGVITEFPIPTVDGYPEEITAGPDGNLYFTEAEDNRIGRITTAGVVTEFPIPTTATLPTGIVTGSNGALYFTELMANQIGQFDVYAPTTAPPPPPPAHPARPTTLVLTFSNPLDPTTAQNARNYTLVNSQGKAIKVASAVYSATDHTVTLKPHTRLSVYQTYHLTINALAPFGVTDQYGARLDGSGTGQAGTNFTTKITLQTLVIPGHTVKLGKSGQATIIAAAQPTHPARTHAHL